MKPQEEETEKARERKRKRDSKRARQKEGEAVRQEEGETEAYGPAFCLLCLFPPWQIMWEIFRRYDDDMNGFLKGNELVTLLSAGFGEPSSLAAAQDYITRYDSSERGLSRDGFVQLVSDLKADRVSELIR